MFQFLKSTASHFVIEYKFNFLKTTWSFRGKLRSENFSISVQKELKIFFQAKVPHFIS